MRQILMTAALILAAIGSTGCSIQHDKQGDGDNVKIATPFGGMQVKTDDSAVLAGIGLPVYPGATRVKKGNDKGDNGAADINMSFGSFQLKVKAASYRTPDSPEQVLAFYKNALGRFGDVIQCDGRQPVGTPTHTSEGLTCDTDNHGSHEAGSNKPTKLQLKAGSRKHQHIVEIDPESFGSKFGLVSLDLPVDFHLGSDDDNKDTKKGERKQ